MGDEGLEIRLSDYVDGYEEDFEDEVFEEVEDLTINESLGMSSELGIVEKTEPVFSGQGEVLKSLVVERGFEFRKGFRYKVIEACAEEAKKDLGDSGGFSDIENPAFISLFIGRLVNTGQVVGFGVKKEVVELDNIVKDVDMEDIRVPIDKGQRISIKENDVKSELDASEKSNIEKEVQGRSLSADGKVMDVVDYCILFLRSSQWAFVLVLVGVFGQAFHIYHVVSNLSDLYGMARVLNSLLWATFLSFGLVYFSLKLSTLDISDIRVRAYKRTVNWFIAFDVFANLYYWAFKFVLIPAVLDKFLVDITLPSGEVYQDYDWKVVDWLTFDISRVHWPQMLAALVFSVSIPFILKSFAGEVRLPEFLDKRFRSYK